MSARRGTGSGGLPLLIARTLLAWVCLIASAICAVSPLRAQDETVLLMVPQTPEPALVELFHRVEAELRLHQFRPEVLVGPPGQSTDSTENLLGAQASAQRAFAAIAIVEQAESAMLDVWIVDSRTGLTRQYRVTQEGGEEPTNVVAVRAIDLLRANRALPSPTPPSAAGAASTAGQAGNTAPPAEASGAAPPRAAADKAARAKPKPSGAQPTPTAADSGEDESADVQEPEIEDSSAPSTLRYKPTLLQLATEVVGLSLSRRMGWSFGPSIGAWLTLGQRLRLGVVGVAPLWGAVLHAPLGEPAIWQELIWLEVGVLLMRAGPLQLSAAGGGGLQWLQARGRAHPPYRSINASTWSWTASLGARADLMLAEHWSIGLTLRARMFTPPVEVAAEAESARLATPAIEGALGVSLWL